MLASILLLGILHHAATSDTAKQSSYVTRPIATCPVEGYFFKREASLNNVDPICYLCFCYDDTTAICWRRENRRCDLKHYRNVGKRDARVRRSPLSLGEVFVRDAAREFFNKQSPEQCKPYESSFSDGCPPADWCIGCTVCDCDANGRWDCHVLSFCPDKNGKKQMKKRRGPIRNRIAKKQSKTSTTKGLTNPTKKPPKKPTRKELKKQNLKKSQVKQNGVNQHKINPVKGTRMKKVAQVKKTNSKFQEKKVRPNMKNATGNSLVIKKGASTNKSINTKPSNFKANKNNTVEVAQKVVKQFMSTMQKMMRNIEKRTANATKQSNKIVRKRSMPKKENKKEVRKSDNKPKFIAKPISISEANKRNKGRRTTPQPYTRSYKSGRNKRQVNLNDSDVNNLVSNGTTDLVLKSGNDAESNRTENYFISTTSSNAGSTSINTNNPIRLERNKEIYITDTYNNTVYEESDSIKHETLFYDFDNLTNFNRSSNYISLTTPRFFSNFSSEFNKNISHITSNMLAESANDTHLNTKLTETGLILKKEDEKKKESEITQNDINNYDLGNRNRKYNINHGCKLWTLLRTLLDRNKNNTRQTSEKPKRYTILTKVRKLFRKIFHKTLKRRCHGNDDLRSKDCKTIVTENKKSKHYKLKLKGSVQLRRKMEELRNESENIMKTIGIIKGLLHILELNTNDTRLIINSTDLSKNINKLNTIIKATFNREEIIQKLTQDQRTQIDYIKGNVLTFIKSMGKFATILDDIIQIVMHHHKIHNNITLTTMSNKNNYEKLSANKDSNNIIQQKLHKLKELMLNYNNLQKKFINQIYSLIKILEINGTLYNNLKKQANSLQLSKADGIESNSDNINNSVSNDKLKKQPDLPIQLTKTDAIETNSVNIIRNIRKLKLLADKLNVHSRRKRETIGDQDAIEYLLILMEYLLKRHTPANPPVNDGIDLLIEAIRSAPDVKPIKKKVLDYVPEKTKIIEENLGNGSRKKLLLAEKNNSQTVGISVEMNKINGSTSYQLDEDDEDDSENIDEIYQKFKSFNDSNSEQKQDEELDSYIYTTSSKSNNIRKLEKKSHKKGNRYPKTMNENLGESEISSSSTMSNNVVLEQDTSTEYYTTLPSNLKSKPRKTEKSQEKEANDFFVDVKANIDWIKENFKDTKQSREIEISLSTPKTFSATRMIKQVKQSNKNINNFSDMSNEIDINRLNNNSEEVMTKKQMNLLNSLDYVGEKNIEDEPISKDDKYSSDDFI